MGEGGEIFNRAERLFEVLRSFSGQLTKCCSDLVVDLMQERRDKGNEGGGGGGRDLQPTERLFEVLRSFSGQLTKCCSDPVVDLMQARRDKGNVGGMDGGGGAGG